MDIENFYDLKICKLKNLHEKPDAGCDLLEIEGEFPSFGFVKPKKIIWRAYLKDINGPIDIIKSKKLKKNLIKWQQDIQDKNFSIEVIPSLSKDDFLTWLKVYRNLIGSKKRANIALDEGWYDTKNSKGKDLGAVFVYKNPERELLGGNIFVYGNEKIIVGYGIVQKIDNSINLGALVDFACIKYAFENEFDIVSFGQDTNLYGLHLPASLFSYKARLGLTPEPQDKYGLVTMKFLSFEKFDQEIIFLDKDKNVMLIYKENPPNPKEFEAKGVERVISQKSKV